MTKSRYALVLIVFMACGGDDETPTGPGQGGVTIYERDNFGGDSRTLLADVVDFSDISGPCTGGNWEDCVSSVRLSPGWTATLYEGDGFDGDALPVVADLANLDGIPGCGAGDWDNCASSIRVQQP